MAGLGKKTAAYERMRDMLETDHLNERVVVYDEKLVGTYESFEAAAEDAIGRFGRGPYLTRRVGAPPLTLPASLLYRPAHAEY